MGLFEIEDLQKTLNNGGTEFMPTFLYSGGVRYDGKAKIWDYLHELSRDIHWRPKRDIDRFDRSSTVSSPVK